MLVILASICGDVRRVDFERLGGELHDILNHRYACYRIDISSVQAIFVLPDQKEEQSGAGTADESAGGAGDHP